MIVLISVCFARTITFVLLNRKIKEEDKGMYIKKSKSENIAVELSGYAERYKHNSKSSDEAKEKTIIKLRGMSGTFSNLTQRTLSIGYKSDDEEAIFSELFSILINKHSIVAVFKVARGLSVEALNKVMKMKKEIDNSIVLISDELSSNDIDVEVNIGYLHRNKILEPTYVIDRLFDDFYKY